MAQNSTKVLKFKMGQNHIITSTDAITSLEVGKYLKDNLEKFPQHSRFIALAGSHADAGGKLAEPDEKFVRDYKGMFKNLNQTEKSKKIIEKRDYTMGEVKSIGTVRGKPSVKDIEHLYTFKMMREQLSDSKHPFVLILGYCFSDINELNNLLILVGVMAVQHGKYDRGLITDAACFLLDDGQQEILEKVGDAHIQSKNPEDLKVQLNKDSETCSLGNL